MYSIEKLKKMFLKGELKSNIYSSVNENEEVVIVVVQEGVGFNIQTNQANGWVRADSYDYDYDNSIWIHGESYAERWK